ncbi:MAG: hypothetical protein R3213_12695 [Flavobacteriaceae bacterium]|nr:hypothetical protein [Flavobacteriaceae bacterium]
MRKIKKKKLELDFRYNPLINNPVSQILPPNSQCLCGKNKKTKNCCGKHKKMPRKQAELIMEYFATIPKQIAINTGVKEKYLKYFKE